MTPLLSTLAYWLHVNKPTGLATEREVCEVLGEAWAYLNEEHWNADDPNPKITEEIRKFLVAVHEHTGLFVERAPKRYGFMHLKFEEYYATLPDRPPEIVGQAHSPAPAPATLGRIDLAVSGLCWTGVSS